MLLNHQLEKAQTYADQRDGYGKEKVTRLLRLIKNYVNQFGYDSLVYTSIGVIKAHVSNIHSFKNDQVIKCFEEILSQVPDRSQLDKERGGIILFSANDLERDTNLFNLLSSRHSCRQFADKAVEKEHIEKAIDYAMTAPSACNRQCVRAHYYDTPSAIKSIVLAQKSDVQWCLNAKGLFVITGDREYFRDYFERNQRMFDAGLFSMNLCLALHNEGIGSCFKMAQKDYAIERATKQIASIPDSEDICVLLLLGYYPKEKSIYAKSTRLNREEILNIHE
jgi:nitroreductase